MKRSKFIQHQKKEQPKDISPSAIEEFPVGTMLTLPKNRQVFKVFDAPRFYSENELRTTPGCSIVISGVYVKLEVSMDESMPYLNRFHLVHISDLKKNFRYMKEDTRTTYSDVF